MAEKEAVPLSAMLGSGTEFEAAGKKYSIKPLKLKDVEQFVADNVSIGPQLFNLLNKKARKTLDKWLAKQVFDEKGEPVTVERAMAEDWDLTDLKNCVQRLLDLSG